MIYYCIVAFPLVFVFAHRLLTNYIIPYFKKRSLYKQVKQREDWLFIEETEKFLKTLYKGIHAKISSVTYRTVRRLTSKEFVYGEIDFLSFYTIFERAEPKHGDIFYDLGSGAGKAVFTAAMFFNLSKSYGIELLPLLYIKATKQLKKVTGLFETIKTDVETIYLKRTTAIQFINDNFLHYDFSDADIIYVAATCLTDATWEALVHKMATLKPGSRIIVATKTIQHQRFELVYQGIELMSWGLCPVKIYKVKLPQVHHQLGHITEVPR